MSERLTAEEEMWLRNGDYDHYATKAIDALGDELDAVRAERDAPVLTYGDLKKIQSEAVRAWIDGLTRQEIVNLIGEGRKHVVGTSHLDRFRAALRALVAE